MNTGRLGILALVIAGVVGGIGCSTPKPEPEIASSAPQSGYAERYPEALAGAATSFGEEEQAAKATAGELQGYPGQLKDPPWDVVLEAVEEADAAGKSYDYVERARTVDGASAFFTEKRDEITKKVAGAAQYVAKQKGCDVDVSGAAAHALKEEVDRQLEEYLHDRNEAHRLIERHRTTLGKENAAALEKQADAISRASYIVHIELVEQKLRVRRMLQELEAVRGSIDEALEAEHAFQSSGKRKDEEKKASEERIEALRRSKGLLESAVTQAKSLDERMEERIAEDQKAYQEALDQLKGALREKAGAEGAPGGG